MPTDQETMPAPNELVVLVPSLAMVTPAGVLFFWSSLGHWGGFGLPAVLSQ